MKGLAPLSIYWRYFLEMNVWTFSNLLKLSALKLLVYSCLCTGSPAEILDTVL